MSFNSLVFAGFLCVVLPLYYVLGRRWQNRLLLAASYVFYGWWDWRFLALLWLTTLAGYVLARAIAARPEASLRKTLLGLSVGLDLLCLGVFKYCNFFSASLAAVLAPFGLRLDPVLWNVLLPVGMSFYTFQSVSYVVDVYRGRQPAARDLTAYALYIAYFPHLVAGPIERASALLPQLLSPRRVDSEKISSGLSLMLVGLFKKIAVADVLAPMASQVLLHPGGYSRAGLLAGLYAFSIRIYCDISGYTDIARGVSRLMGIELSANFLQPYFSADFSEFWRRWHITLSTWFTDYVYYPLARRLPGWQPGNWVDAADVLVVFLLCGLWHGASWTFVVWGGLHGCFVAARRFLPGLPRSRPAKAASIALTFHLVTLSWAFFAAPDLRSAWTILSGLVDGSGTGVVSWAPLAYGAVCVLLLDWPAWRWSASDALAELWPLYPRWVAYGLMAWLCLYLAPSTGSAFLYFQF